MTKIINIHSGKEVEYPQKTYSVCSICECTFSHEDEGGVVGGAIGMIPVNFCPFCLSGILDMSQQMLGVNNEEI
tara:strand:- start:98 stop:319 length:222 start_codon:yes stop_codon:yes gene_type:complete